MKKVMLTAMLVLVVMVVAACADGGKNNQTPSNAEGKESAVKKEQSAQTSQTAGEPLGKYDPPISVTTVRSLGSAIKFAEGESIDNNIWYRGYEEDLGITLKNDWSVPETQYLQKLNIAVASGNIPDITPVDLAQLQKLYDADMIEDLTEAYEAYATELTRSVIEGDGGSGMMAATFGGKLMALPSTTSTLDATQMIWVRQDWLDGLGLAGPQTLEDVREIAEAFVSAKPSGHERTYGLALQQDVLGGYGSIGGLSNGFGAYPGAWLAQADRSIVYGSVQPEMKEALGMLREMFAAGLIDPEFGVQDANKLNESIASGQVGLFYGQHWNAFWPLPDSFNNDNGADWRSYPLVAHEGEQAKPLAGKGASNYYVVKKGAKHPEAVIKMMNYNLEKQYGEAGRDMDFHGKNVIPVYQYAAVYAQHPYQNINIYREVIKGLEQGSGEGLSFDGADNLGSILKYQEGDNAFWGSYKWAGPDGALSIEDYYDDEKLYVLDAYLGAPTATMLTKGSTLDALEMETFTKIIMNTIELDAFDTFVDNWKKLGGDQMTEEVNAWAANR